MSKSVFERMKIGELELKNRIIRSAAGSGIASADGYVTDDVLDWFERSAGGGAGLLISEMMSAWEDGNFPGGYLRIDHNSYIEGLKGLTDLVHRSGSRVVAQIGNYGTLLHREPVERPFAPSAVADPVSGIVGKEMDEQDIRFVVRNFAQAAGRAKEAGFDGVQIHGAHGFLLNQFLNPYTNRREDLYGGSTGNRFRIITEILDAVKEECGIYYPVMLKINISDFAEDGKGLEFEESRAFCVLASEAGFDAIEISGGLAGGKVSPARPAAEEAYHRSFATIVADELDCPVILVGGIRRLPLAQEILETTAIEGIAMTRALIREPELIRQWREGDDRPSDCVCCNRCFATEGQHCIFRSV